MFLEFFITSILLKAKRPFKKKSMSFFFPKEIEKMIIDYKDQLETTEKYSKVLIEMDYMHYINTGMCNNCLENKYSINWISLGDINYCGTCLDNMGLDEFLDENDPFID